MRAVKKWFPKKQVIPALFADPRLAKWYIDPIKQGPDLAVHMKANGLLIDTFDKGLGYGRILQEMDTCNRRFYTVAHICRRLWNSLRQRRAPLFLLVSNLSFRSNIRADRDLYKKLDVSRGPALIG